VGGGRSAFIVAANPSDPGNFSGFGMTYTFPSPWALPADPNQWTNYVFSFDFKEANNAFPCVIEMQIKSAPDRWLEFTKQYTPGPGGWDSVRGSLNQFVLPGGVGPFDPNHIESIVVNIRNLQIDATYLGQFDNIVFTGPPTANPNVVLASTYTSTNDSLLDSDHDGIPDVTEAGLGTNPFNPDTDGDGLSDGMELVAGTDPLSSADVLRLTSVTPNGLGGMILSWPAKAGRSYTVQCFDGSLAPGARFIPAGTLTNLTALSNGPMQATDPTAGTAVQRTYRITVRLP
jgi:hypothetical protein